MDYVADAHGEAEAIVAYDRFWRAWADKIVTVHKAAVPAELAPLIEEFGGGRSIVNE